MAWRHEGSRHARGYGREWDKLRAQALGRDKYLCQPCLQTNRVTPATQVDHKQARAAGGTDDLDNLQSICGPCHDAKTAKEAAQAQGRTYKPRLAFDGRGNPIWPADR